METDQEHVVTGQLSPEVGDYLVLTAMHVTTKEIPHWTFQTFWWTPYPDAPPFGADRVPQVRGVFRNYAMCNAWNEDLPVTATGGPHICFNPYLEAVSGTTNMGEVFNAGHVSRSAPYYAHIITTDFLWSIPLMARAEKKKGPPRTASLSSFAPR
jgi:hypothetical protein